MTSVCGICSIEPSKYKCPACQLSSCSLKCSTAHKEQCRGKAHDAPGSEAELTTDVRRSSSTTRALCSAIAAHPAPVPPSAEFFALINSAELQHLFTKYPSLRSQLQTIYDWTQRPHPSSSHAQDSHPRDRRHNRVRGKGQNPRLGDRGQGHWTPEKGFYRALSLMKDLRNEKGLAEFSELVLMKCPMHDIDFQRGTM